MSDTEEGTGSSIVAASSGLPRGRPRKEQQVALKNALSRAAPPAKVEKALDAMYALAEKHGSWKGYEAWIRLTLEYQLGKAAVFTDQPEGDLIAIAVARYRAEREAIDAEFTVKVVDDNTVTG